MVVAVVGGSVSKPLGLLFLDSPPPMEVLAPAFDGRDEVMATVMSYYLMTINKLSQIEIAEDMMG